MTKYTEIMCDLRRGEQCTNSDECLLKTQDGKCTPAVKASKDYSKGITIKKSVQK